MKCNACEYNFAITDINYTGKEIRCKYQICLYKIKEDKRRCHKCYNCPWGTWTGLSYKCALPRCMPKLGSFNGVDKNDKR